jgi:hypothetical protein
MTIVSPTQGQVFHSTDDIVAIVTGAAPGPTSWTAIDTGTTELVASKKRVNPKAIGSHANPALVQISHAFGQLTTGMLQLTITDSAGNQATVTITVIP